MSRGAYIEGYVASAHIVRPDGSTALEVVVPYKRWITRDLPSGRYRFEFSVRPCDANCGYLDPVDARCRAPFRIAEGDDIDVHVVVRPGAGCKMRTR